MDAFDLLGLVGDVYGALGGRLEVGPETPGSQEGRATAGTRVVGSLREGAVSLWAEGLVKAIYQNAFVS